MNQPSTTPPLKFTALEKDLRTIAAAVVCGLSIANLYVTGYTTSDFAFSFRAAFDGKPLPLGTQFIIDNQNALLAVAILLPLTVIISAIYVRNHLKLALIVSVAVVLVFLQAFMTLFCFTTTLATPLHIISSH